MSVYHLIVMSQEPITGELNKKVDDLSEKVDSVLDAIGEFSTKIDERFNKIDSRLDKMDGRLDSMDSRLDKMDGRLDGMDSRLTRVESQMVTKEYLDDKLINLKADLTVVMRKEDHKHEALTNLLASKKVITDADAKSILSMEPFPQRA
jgi:archaellum component FlaC